MSDKVIFEWIERIGLKYAVSTFREKGCDTLEKFKEIQEDDFETVYGVVKDQDKDKLAALLERVRIVLQRKGKEVSQDESESIDKYCTYSQSKKTIVSPIKGEEVEKKDPESLQEVKNGGFGRETSDAAVLGSVAEKTDDTNFGGHQEVESLPRDDIYDFRESASQSESENTEQVESKMSLSASKKETLGDEDGTWRDGSSGNEDATSTTREDAPPAPEASDNEKENIDPPLPPSSATATQKNTTSPLKDTSTAVSSRDSSPSRHTTGYVVGDAGAQDTATASVATTDIEATAAARKRGLQSLRLSLINKRMGRNGNQHHNQSKSKKSSAVLRSPERTSASSRMTTASPSSSTSTTTTTTRTPPARSHTNTGGRHSKQRRSASKRVDAHARQSRVSDEPTVRAAALRRLNANLKSPLRNALSPSPRVNRVDKRAHHRHHRRERENDICSRDRDSSIRVCVRKRPLSKRERRKKETDVTQLYEAQKIRVREPRTKVDLTDYVETHDFIFDEVFGENDSTEHIYQRTVKMLVKCIFRGGNATCFAYGQTGSGKTYTMLGDGAECDHDSRATGLYVLAARDIFDGLQNAKHEGVRAHVSFYEIYGNGIFDLLNDRKKLRCMENSSNRMCIMGLTEQHVASVDDLLRVMKSGTRLRKTGSTGANIDSSRSHAILQIALRDVRVVEKEPSKRVWETSSSTPPVGTLCLIDLAGSERGKDTTHNSRQRRLEGAEINKSLLALKECIRALHHKSSHTPFRGSKLTQVLKDSFVGESAHTVMIATIAPNVANCEHTLNTLRYAYRVKEMVETKPEGSLPSSTTAAAVGAAESDRVRETTKTAI
eukprot:g1459.t1